MLTSEVKSALIDLMSTSTQSIAYARRVKRVVTLIKGLYPTLRRIPSPLPRPGSEALWTPKVGDAKKDAQRREDYGVRDAKRLDSSIPTFFLIRSTDDTPRRTRS